MGQPIVFIYHPENSTDDGLVHVGAYMTVARSGHTGRFARTDIRKAAIRLSDVPTTFNTGVGGAAGAGRGTCFWTHVAVQPTTILGAKRAGDHVRIKLTVAGRSYVRTISLRHGNLDTSAAARKTAGCRSPR